MAGLNFEESGDFMPYVSYSAKSGRWSRKVDGKIQEIEKPVFVADFFNIRTGWFNYQTGQAPKIVYNKSLTEKTPRPEGLDKDGKSLFKEGFSVQLFSKTQFAGVVEFSSNSILVRNSIGKLYGEYEEGVKANAGMLPVVECSGVTAETSKEGNTNYAPNFKILKWVGRPAEFDAAPPPVAAAPEKASVSEF